MNFSQDFIDKVRDANNIVDLFSEFTQLKRSGDRQTGLCPFPGHNEKTPSFSVSEDKQVYYCFGCQRSGQIFTALKELKGLNFPEAVEYLAKRAGIALPTEYTKSSASSEAKNQREKLYKLNKYVAQVYAQQLQKVGPQHYATTYAAKRGLTPEIIKLFEIGFAPNQWDFLTHSLINVKAPLEQAAQLGLIRHRKEGEGYFDIFRDRLMFPIYSHKGDCVGFGGRAFTDEQMPKYLNSSESDVFSKGHTFYGLYETAKFIRTEASVIVVEGYMDFLALYAAGIKNVVATLGTALTPYHAKLLKRYTPNVIVLFDGDDAGKAAATRSLPILLAEELLPKAVFLPDRLDPDEYIKEKGVDSLRELLKTAPDLFTVILDRELREYRGAAADKVTLLNTISPILEATTDSRLKDLYVSEVAQKISVDANWVKKNLGHGPNRAKVAENRQPIAKEMPKHVIDMRTKINLKGSPTEELFLLNIALMSPARFKTIFGMDFVSQLSNVGVREMFNKADSFYRQMPNEFAKLSAYLMTLSEQPAMLGLHLGEPLRSMNDEALDKLVSDCARKVKEKFLRSKTREIASSLRASTTEEQNEMLEQIMNIQKSKHTLRRDRES